MIQFERYTLSNGLRVILHHDPTTPLAVVNTLYDVGARDEDEGKTGFAHLFEHLMFGGSKHIPDFDAPLQNAGGESNAFTSNDITNYYNTLPKENLETALWLESDRMLSLAFTPKSLEVQRNVVIEEFKQRYLNQPYGNTWLELRPLAYKTHPYKWATIGKEISHIENATMDDVKDFFYTHYHPANAILVVAGNLNITQTKKWIDQYFAPIEPQIKKVRQLAREERQNEFREKDIHDKVPANAFHLGFHMCDRLHPDYFASDVLSDLLGRDKSSWLYIHLKKEKQLVSEISAYLTGSLDPGMFVISGKLNEGVSFKQLEEALWEALELFNAKQISKEEFSKAINKISTGKEFQEQGILNRAMNLAHYELLGDAEEINKELEYYNAITPQQIQRVGQDILRKSNCSILRTHAQKN